MNFYDLAICRAVVAVHASNRPASAATVSVALRRGGRALMNIPDTQRALDTLVDRGHLRLRDGDYTLTETARRMLARESHRSTAALAAVAGVKPVEEAPQPPPPPPSRETPAQAARRLRREAAREREEGLMRVAATVAEQLTTFQRWALTMLLGGRPTSARHLKAETGDPRRELHALTGLGLAKHPASRARRHLWQITPDGHRTVAAMRRAMDAASSKEAADPESAEGTTPAVVDVGGQTAGSRAGEAARRGGAPLFPSGVVRDARLRLELEALMLAAPMVDCPTVRELVHQVGA